MSEYVSKGAIKVLEIIGISEESFDDAVSQAVAKAAETIDGITGVEVTSQTARVKDGKVTQYHATVKLAFAVK
ncbi:MAG: dodecin family protein [Acidimicrobiia bacterium]|nr:dodecin family protein [Acidimicrobiia bacterium]